MEIKEKLTKETGWWKEQIGEDDKEEDEGADHDRNQLGKFPEASSLSRIARMIVLEQ